MATSCEAECGSGGELLRQEPTLTEELARKRQRLEQQIADIKRAEELLAEEPKMQELLDIIGRTRRI